MHGAAGDKLARGMLGQPHLFFRAEQDDVGKRRLDRVADAARAVRRVRSGHGERDRFLLPAVRLRHLDRRRAQVAQMSRIDGERAGEGAAQHLVGGDQSLQPLVDLPVRPLAALLDGHHHDQTHAHADEGEQCEAEQRHEDAVPGAEIEIAQALLRG